ncbi:odorant receptor Or2-like [Melitaea cinxia]|uniref:odorant receptor Or2-like n=1 Tax=Melitaea cinxia TaxID=113334 RepID=UPI001E273F0D|nr:odorant receptor Or2-like [Melitaea cinxia]
MLFKIFKNLEDPIYPLLGPNLWGLRNSGLWQPNKGFSKIIYNILHFFVAVFVLTQYIELWLIRSNLDMALRNLSYSIIITICVVKAGTFISWQKYWKEVFENVTLIEKKQQGKHDDETKKIIAKYTEYSRIVTYLYWCLVIATIFAIVLAPLVIYLSSHKLREEIRNGTAAYPDILSSWAPFDKTRGFGYWVLFGVHTFICSFGGGIVANYDTSAVVLMTFFAGQFEVLKSNCEKLFGNGQEYINYDEVIRRIRDCHEHHVQLIKYSKILNSLLSPVLFLYIISSSLMICSSAIQLTKEGTIGMQQVWIAEYLLALTFQLFLYCWHSTNVLSMSLKVDEGVYSSAWWSQDVRVRRCVVLLAGQLNRRVVFTAGPFTELSVATFITMLKGSYSYYTLLSKK